MPVQIDKDLCETCGNCFEVCSYEVYDDNDGIPVVVRIDNCIECGLCISECPTGAISWIEYHLPEQ